MAPKLIDIICYLMHIRGSVVHHAGNQSAKIHQMMKSRLTILAHILLVIMHIAFSLSAFSQAAKPTDPPGVVQCLTDQEWELIGLINAIRAEYGKPPVPLSAALTTVAKLHVADLNAHPPEYKGVCNLHSWSSDGPWTDCCYTSDHLQRDCMYNKPSELTHYKYDGFEIAYYLENGATPQRAVKGWKKSQSHFQLMCSQGPWGMINLEAMGVAIMGSYAVAWFGRMTDPSGPPENCK